MDLTDKSGIEDYGMSLAVSGNAFSDQEVDYTPEEELLFSVLPTFVELSWGVIPFILVFLVGRVGIGCHTSSLVAASLIASKKGRSVIVYYPTSAVWLGNTS